MLEPEISRKLWSLIQQVPEGPGRPSREMLLDAVRDDLREVLEREQRQHEVIEKLRKQLLERNAAHLSGRLSGIESKLDRILLDVHSFDPACSDPARCRVCQKSREDH